MEDIPQDSFFEIKGEWVAEFSAAHFLYTLTGY
jgi:hypothetical protein